MPLFTGQYKTAAPLAVEECVSNNFVIQAGLAGLANGKTDCVGWMGGLKG